MHSLKIKPTHYNYELLLRCALECGVGDPNLFVADNERETDDGHQNPRIDREENLSDAKSLSLVPKAPNLLMPKPDWGDIVGLNAPLDEPWHRLALLGGPTGIIKHAAKTTKEKPNVKMFTLLLRLMPTDSNSTRSERALLQLLKDYKTKPDSGFFNSLLSRRTKDPTAAKEVIRMMSENGISPDLVTVGTLAETIGRSNFGLERYEEAQRFLSESEEYGIRPNLEILTTLTMTGLRTNDYIYAQKILNEFVFRNIKPDERFLGTLELFRSNTRDKLIKMERQKDLTQQDKRNMSKMKNYLMNYTKFLKNTKIERDQHPWDQFKTKKKENNINM